MPDQDKINDVAKQVAALIDKAKLEIAQDLLKLKDAMNLAIIVKYFVDANIDGDFKKIEEIDELEAKDLLLTYNRTKLTPKILKNSQEFISKKLLMTWMSLRVFNLILMTSLGLV